MHTTDFIKILDYQKETNIESTIIKHFDSKILFIIDNIEFETAESLKDFSKNLGKVVDFGDLSGNFFATQVVKKNAVDKKSYGGWYYLGTEGFGDWHYDGVASQDTYSHTCVYSHQLPGPNRGDTIFSFTNIALRDLSSTYKKLLDDLRITHVQRPIKNWPQEWFEKMSQHHDLAHVFKKTTRPIISSWHGLKGIYVSPSRAWNIEGMYEEESQGIIDFLSKHIVRDEYCYRHAWKPNQLVIWNNWLSLHYPVNDYDCNERELWRVCIDCQ